MNQLYHADILPGRMGPGRLALRFPPLDKEIEALILLRKDWTHAPGQHLWTLPITPENCEFVAEIIGKWGFQVSKELKKLLQQHADQLRAAEETARRQQRLNKIAKTNLTTPLHPPKKKGLP